jgi:hypothetical protein
MRATLLSALTFALLLGGCGGGEDPDPAEPRGPASAQLRRELATATRVDPASFPVADGRSLREIADTLDGSGPQLAPATASLRTGERVRLAFGLIDQQTGFVYAPTVVYVARGARGRARGPFVAPPDLLVTDPPFRSRTAASEEDPFAAVYEASVPFEEPGRYHVLAVSKVAGGLYGAGITMTVRSAAGDPVPAVGEPAPRVRTDTLAAAGGNAAAIETRVPPDTMHDVDFAGVAGRKPVALLFATPQLCQSRVCGPVVDIAEQLKRTYGDRMAFIHQEVYVGNQLDKGLRPPLRAFGLRTEPWLFTVDRRGRIAARLEGSFGFTAFKRAIEAALP